MLRKLCWQPQGVWQLLQLPIDAYIRTSVCNLFMIPGASRCHKSICMQVNKFLPLFDKIFLLHLTPPYAIRCLFCPYSLPNYIQPVFLLDYTCEEKVDQKVYANCINYAHVYGFYLKTRLNSPIYVENLHTFLSYICFSSQQLKYPVVLFIIQKQNQQTIVCPL